MTFVADNLLQLTYSSRGPYGLIWEFSAEGAGGSITLREEAEVVILETIDIEPSGTGLGSAIIERLRLYADQEGKELSIPAVFNPSFFARFDWLEWSGPRGDLWSALYKPAG